MSMISASSTFDVKTPATTGLTRYANVSELSDAAGNASTAYTLSVGDTLFGRILTTSDQDWVAVNLVAGQGYVFWVHGVGGSFFGIDDTTLTVFDSSSNQVAYQDDALASGGNFFSAVQFTATTTGTYYIQVAGHPNPVTGYDNTGRYALEVSYDTFTVDEVATYLTEFDWGNPTAVSFSTSPGGTLTYNINALTAAGQQLAQWALEAWTNALGITFQQSSSASADIIFDDNQPGAFAGPSSFNSVNGIVSQSSVNVGTSWLATYGTTIDSYSYLTYLHEIGHALGLGHAGPYDGNATYGSDNLYLNDSSQLTVMSYFDPSQNPNVNASDVTILTPMLADLVALHGLYGTPTAYTGDTVWGENSNVGGWLQTAFGAAFEGLSTPIMASGTAVGFTIFDTAGTDTIDFGTQTANQLINLRAESISNVAGSIGNMVIGRNVVIENAIGGSGNDQIIGNQAANRLEGRGGNDTINGGAGTDTAVLAIAFSGATATDLGGGQIQVVSSLGTDIYSNIENFEFTDGTVTAAVLLAGIPGSTTTPTAGNDTLTGTAGGDLINGGAGDDSISGGDGNDGLRGEDGNDTLDGGAGDDSLPGANGDDVLRGGTGNDRMGGGFGNDQMLGGDGNDSGGGGPGNDTMDGGAGDDLLSGGSGDDTVDGGAGNDTVAGSFGSDLVRGGAGHDSIGGGNGFDTISGGDGNDTIGAGGHDDSVTGDAGNDFIGGGDGNDTLDGGTGMDTLNGGNGDDRLTGGADADVFVFNNRFGDGADVITDFQDGVDMIRLVGLPVLADPMARVTITDVATGAEVVYGNFTITVEGVAAADLTVDDFLFT